MKTTIFRNSSECGSDASFFSVLIVLRSLEMGGSQKQAVLLAKELRDSYRARVAIWTLEKGGPLEETLAAAGIPWENHAAIIKRKRMGKIPALIALTRSMRRWRPNAIIPFNDFPNKVCGAVWPWSGAEICIWNQRDEGREITGSFLEQMALKQVQVYTANSLQGVEFLRDKFAVPGEHITIIHNGVNLDPPRRTREEWRAEIGISPQAILVTMIANLHHFKDHETLLRAWAQIATENNKADLHLALAGQPGDTSTMLHDICKHLAIGKSVHFIGLTEDVSGLLGASDIGVFSSRLEGMPNGVLESMAAGLPVAATRITGIAEALGKNYPLLAPPGDAPALAASLLTLIHDTNLRTRLGSQNQKRARENFSVATMGQHFINVLRPFLTGPLGKRE